MNDEDNATKEDDRPSTSPQPECSSKKEEKSDKDDINEVATRNDKNGRRRRPRNASQDRQKFSASSSECSFHEANEKEVSGYEEAVKRKYHRSSSPPSSESFASCEGQEENMEAKASKKRDNSSDDDDSVPQEPHSPQSLGEEYEEEILEDDDDDNEEDSDDDQGDDIENEDDDESDDDEDELVPIQIKRFMPSDDKHEKPAVLIKVESKSRYNFLQDYLSLSQFSMRPGEFKRRRQGDLGLVRRFEQSHKLEGHNGCVNAIHFNEAGSMLASGSDDLEIIVWDWHRGNKLFSFQSGHASNVFQSKFLPLTGDTHIVTTSRDGQVRLAQLCATGCRSTRKLAQHKGPAHKLALLTGRPHELISGGEDGVIMTLDVRESKPSKLCKQMENESTVRIYSVHSSPVDDQLIVSAGSDQYIRLYDRRKVSTSSPQPLQKFCPHQLENERTLHITCAIFSNDGQDIIGSYSDEDIYLFKTRDSNSEEKPNFYKRYQGHCNSQTVKGVNFYGPNSEFIVSGSDCGHVFFWDKEGEDIVHLVEGDEEGVVNCLEPHPNLPVMATSGLDHQVKIWTPTGQEFVKKSYITETVMKNSDPRQRMYDNTALGGGRLIFQILRQMQRARFRGGINLDDTSDDDEDGPGRPDFDDDESDDEAPMQCAQS